MHKKKDELYESIKNLKTKKEFEDEIKNRFIENKKLLDKDTIALLIVDELERNNQVLSKISEIKPDSEYTVVGKITNIYESKSFKRKNGTSGKVINLDISDDTGSCRLVLWNKDVEQVKNKNITVVALIAKSGIKNIIFLKISKLDIPILLIFISAPSLQERNSNRVLNRIRYVSSHRL